MNMAPSHREAATVLTGSLALRIVRLKPAQKRFQHSFFIRFDGDFFPDFEYVIVALMLHFQKPHGLRTWLVNPEGFHDSKSRGTFKRSAPTRIPIEEVSLAREARHLGLGKEIAA